MVKPKKGVNLNPNSEFDVALAKMNAIERGRAMANGESPDRWDYDNIDKALKIFEAKFPGLIAKIANGVHQEVQASDMDKNAVLIESSQFRKGFWLPAEFQPWLEEAYPTFWVNQKHANWFMRNFPVFSYTTYTKRIKT